MSCQLKSIEINNFKSFKDFKLNLKEFNVIVGPNSAGKTNLIEFFKFMKTALVGVSLPYTPYLEWWSYKNIVWNGRTDLPISARFEFEIDGLIVTYSLSFIYEEKNFKMKSENLSIRDIINIERDGLTLKVKHNMKSLDIYKDIITDFLIETKKNQDPFFSTFEYEQFEEQKLILRSEYWNLFQSRPIFGIKKEDETHDLEENKDQIEKSEIDDQDISFVIFAVDSDFRIDTRRFVFVDLNDSEVLIKAISSILNFFNNLSVLRHPNMEKMKSPSRAKKESLKEDGSNLTSILFNNFISKGVLLERLNNGLKNIFPNKQISFEYTYNSEIFMKVLENGIEFEPPDISDGFYKFLLLLSAIDMNTEFILIDEIENSLYADTLEYIISELRCSKKTIIVTTHSPLVVDLVELEDIMIAEKMEEGTQIYEIPNPDKLRNKLNELGITQSDSWLYGAFE